MDPIWDVQAWWLGRDSALGRMHEDAVRGGKDRVKAWESRDEPKVHLLAAVMAGGVDVQEKLPLLLDVMLGGSGVEGAQLELHPAAGAMADVGHLGRVGADADAQVAAALEAAAEQQDAGAALRLLLSDPRVREAAGRMGSWRKPAEAACKAGNAGGLRLLLGELGLGAGAGGQRSAGGGQDVQDRGQGRGNDHGPEEDGVHLLWLRGLLRLAAAHHCGAVLLELLSAGVRLGADAAAGAAAARSACRGGSAECLRLLAAECGAERVAAWDGRELLHEVLWAPKRSERSKPNFTFSPQVHMLPVMLALVEVLDEASGGGKGQALIAELGPEGLFSLAAQAGSWDVAAWALQALQPPSTTSKAPPPPSHAVCGASTCVPPTGIPLAAAPPPTANPSPAVGEAAAVGVSPVLRAVGSGDTALVEGLLERSTAMVAVCLDRAIPLAAYHGHVGILRALLARFLWHHALLSADIWAGVQAAAIGGSMAVVEVLLGALRARAGRYGTSVSTAMFADVRQRALRAGHKGVAEALARGPEVVGTCW